MISSHLVLVTSISIGLSKALIILFKAAIISVELGSLVLRIPSDFEASDILSDTSKINSKAKVSGGVVHTVPMDLREALTSDPEALELWESLTPLARNEWICWTILVKKEETRKDHVRRVISELKEGMRRPCCWLGCIHRTDKPLSPSVRAMLNKKL